MEERLQKQVDMGSSGLDIMHGHLKVLMLEAENQLSLAQETEAESGEAMDSMVRTYWEGQCEALANLYSLTYDLSFAIQDSLTKNKDFDILVTNQQKGNEMQHEHYWDTPSDKSLVAECACGEQLERIQE